MSLVYAVYARVILELIIAVFRLVEFNAELVALKRQQLGLPMDGVAQGPVVHPSSTPAAYRACLLPGSVSPVCRRLTQAYLRLAVITVEFLARGPKSSFQGLRQTRPASHLLSLLRSPPPRAEPP
jgi:hypothetical protein